jgi:spore maturation protein CgeB
MNLEDFEFSTRFLMQGKKYNMPVMLWYTKKPSPRPALSFGTNRTD